MRKKLFYKIYKNQTIARTILWSFTTLIAISIAIVSIISYNLTVSNLKENAIKYNAQLLKEVNRNIDSYMTNIKNMANVIVDNKDVINLLSTYKYQDVKSFNSDEKSTLTDIKIKASEHMQNIEKTRSEIKNIAIISLKGDVIFSNLNKKANKYSGYNLKDWYLKPLSYKYEAIVSPSHVQNLVEGEYSWVISVSKAVIDYNTGEVVGVMIIDLDYNVIEEICSSVELPADGYIYILDKFYNIIYHPSIDLIYSGMKTEKINELVNLSDINSSHIFDNMIYTTNNSESTDWITISATNKSGILANKEQLIIYYVILGFISVAIATIVSYVISKNITSPIKNLESSMKKVTDGDLSIRSNIELNNEIGKLSTSFNIMTEQTEELLNRLVSNEKQKRESEIKALQAQINPHFLYNTLESIIWLSASGKNDEVVEITSALSKLFRTSIGKGDRFVLFKLEIQNIKSYLTIQSVRYQDVLNYEIEINPDVLNEKVPTLILQPIVENAIYHGLKPRDGAGNIKILAQKDEKMLIIDIIDDGVGMTGDKIEKILTKETVNNKGIGVLNVHERIKLLYGDEYGLSFESELEKGTKVTIKIPLKQGEQ